MKVLNTHPKISIVTISYNQSKYLEDTILSVLNQNYPNLEYIIIDGGSNDGSVDIIKKYAHRLHYWVSEPDNGQYHAVQKGFSKCTGEILAWINSDDKYLPTAFETVAEVFKVFPDVNWLMGIPGEFTENGLAINRISLPWARWSKHRFLTNDFQFIQQESTFWRKKVWEEAGGKMDTSVKYAGDMELWARFFRKEKLYTVTSNLAGFRHRNENQISKTFADEYLTECCAVVKRERELLNSSQKAGRILRQILKFFLSPFFFLDIPVCRELYRVVFEIPPVIIFDFSISAFLMGNNYIKMPPLVLGRWLIQKKPRRIKQKND